MGRVKPYCYVNKFKTLIANLINKTMNFQYLQLYNKMGEYLYARY